MIGGFPTQNDQRQHHRNNQNDNNIQQNGYGFHCSLNGTSLNDTLETAQRIRVIACYTQIRSCFAGLAVGGAEGTGNGVAGGELVGAVGTGGEAGGGDQD